MIEIDVKKKRDSITYKQRKNRKIQRAFYTQKSKKKRTHGNTRSAIVENIVHVSRVLGLDQTERRRVFDVEHSNARSVRSVQTVDGRRSSDSPELDAHVLRDLVRDRGFFGRVLVREEFDVRFFAHLDPDHVVRREGSQTRMVADLSNVAVFDFSTDLRNDFGNCTVRSVQRDRVRFIHDSNDVRQK